MKGTWSIWCSKPEVEAFKPFCGNTGGNFRAGRDALQEVHSCLSSFPKFLKLNCFKSRIKKPHTHPPPTHTQHCKETKSSVKLVTAWNSSIPLQWWSRWPNVGLPFQAQNLVGESAPLQFQSWTSQLHPRFNPDLDTATSAHPAWRTGRRTC